MNVWRAGWSGWCLFNCWFWRKSEKKTKNVFFWFSWSLHTWSRLHCCHPLLIICEKQLSQEGGERTEKQEAAVWFSQSLFVVYRCCITLRSASSQSADTYTRNGTIHPRTILQIPATGWTLSPHLYFYCLGGCFWVTPTSIGLQIWGESVESVYQIHTHTLALIRKDASIIWPGWELPRRF